MCVYKIPKRFIGPDLNDKWDDRWGKGVFLGVRPTSNEIYVGTPSGVIKCRTIRRRMVADRWDIQVLESFKGVPWDMEQGVDGQGEVPAEHQLQPLPAGERIGIPEPMDRNFAHRDFIIHRKEIRERQRTHGDGYTLNCPGCVAARQGTVPKNHNDRCRSKWRAII